MSKAPKKGASAPVTTLNTKALAEQNVDADTAPEGVEGVSVGRVFRGEQKVHHDLFRLQLAKMLKNVGIDDQAPDVEKVDHTHFYRTVDSNGKSLAASAPVGGHHHNVKVSYDDKGNIQMAVDASGKIKRDAEGKPYILAEISGPMRWVKKKVKGKWRRFEEPMKLGKGEDAIPDEHEHGMVYLRSQLINVRNIDPKAAAEAAKVESDYRAKRDGAVEGVRVGSV